MKHLFLICTSLLVASSSFASSYRSDFRLLTVYHFDKVAFGKTVKSVMVHTGVQHVETDFSGKYTETWKSVTDIILAPSKDGFSAKAAFMGSNSGNSGQSEREEAIMAQYWVTFQDGSTLVTIPAAHKIDGVRATAVMDGQNQFVRLYKTEVENFVRTTNNVSTGVIAYSYDDEARKVEEEFKTELAPFLK